MNKYLSVGYVLKPQGISGEIKVESLADNVEQFSDWDILYTKKANQYLPLKVIGKRYKGNHVFLRLEGYVDINSAEELRNQYLWITRSQAKILPEDVFYITDIIQCKVYTQEGEELGQVDRIIHTGSNDVYVVKGSMGEILIPGLKKVVIGVDVRDKRITVATQELEGLLPDAD